MLYPPPNYETDELLGKDFFLFPCGHNFHVNCLYDTVLKNLRSKEEPVMDQVCAAFQKRTHWRLRELAELTKQPEVLNLYCKAYCDVECFKNRSFIKNLCVS